MKYTFFGFSQQKMIEFEMDLIDAAILRYFVDFKDSGKMHMEIINGKPFYWLKYDSILKSVPIISIKSKDTLRRRLKKMCENKILQDYTKRQGGIFSFYALGENYKSLISSNHTTQKSEGPIKKSEGATQKSEPYDLKVGTHTTQKSEQIINLLKDSSIKDSSSTTEAEILIDEEIKELGEIYQKCGFRWNGLTPDWLNAIKEEYGFKWSKNALLVAEKKGYLTKSYVEGILRNWHNDGGMKLGGGSNGKSKQGDDGESGEYEGIGFSL